MTLLVDKLTTALKGAACLLVVISQANGDGDLKDQLRKKNFIFRKLDFIKRESLNFSLPIFNYSYSLKRHKIDLNIPYCYPILSAQKAQEVAFNHMKNLVLLGDKYYRGDYNIENVNFGMFLLNKKVVCGYQVEVSALSPMGVWNVYVDPVKGKVLSMVQTSCAFDEQGKGVSRLINGRYGDPDSVGLHFLAGTGSLDSEFFTVRSDSQENFFSKENNFVAPVDDPKFDQSQGYYLAQTTFDTLMKSITINTNKTLRILLHDKDSGDNGFYLSTSTRSSIRIGDAVKDHRISEDPDIILHELGHYWLEMLLNHRIENDTSSASAINEGFADFIAAHFTNDPIIGEFYQKGGVRRIDITPGMDSSDPHINGIAFANSLWKIRNMDHGFEFILEAIRSVPLPLEFSTLYEAFLEVDQKSYGGKFQSQINETLKPKN